MLVTETHKGFLLSKPQKNEMLVQQYLYEQYGEAVLSEDKLYYELFRQYVSVLYEHMKVESELPNTEMILVSDVDLDLLNELHTYGSVRNLKDRRNDLYEVKMKK